MAQPYTEISKTQFNQNYNVVKILTDKSLIMKQLQTFNSNNQAVAFGVRKTHKLTLEDLFAEIKDIKEQHKISLDAVIFEMRNGFEQINLRIDNIVKLNNLKE